MCSVTVLVATRDRPDDLDRCMESVLASTHRDFEVVVVDQSAGADDRPRPSWADDERVRWLQRRTVGKCTGLNEGIATARGEIVVMTDDDCTVDADWLERMAACFDDDRVAAVYGPLVPIEHDPDEELVPVFIPHGDRRVESPRDARRVVGVAGANTAIRSDVLERVGPFDEVLGPGAPLRSLEELDMAYRILEASGVIRITGENPVVHWGARSWASGDAARLVDGYYFGEAAVWAKHVRCGDRHLLGQIARKLGGELKGAAAGAVRSRSWPDTSPLRSFVRGLYAGWRTPLDRRRRLFVTDAS